MTALGAMAPTDVGAPQLRNTHTARSAIHPAPSRERLETCDMRALRQPAALILNPHAGRKLGHDTNTHSPEEVLAALRAEGIPFQVWETEGPGHATALAQRALIERRELVIGAGGDGTIHEVARGLVHTNTALAVMPLGSIMNLARTLWIPRDPAGAARTITAGQVLAMDVGRNGEHMFLEGAGVGLLSGLFGYFDKLDNAQPSLAVVRAALRFVRQLGSPNVFLDFDGGRLDPSTLVVNVANAPYIGAAFAVAPEARLDDGLLDVTVLDRSSLQRLVMYLAMIADGRSAPPPPHTRSFRTSRLRVAVGEGERPLPVHVDGVPMGATPATFDVMPGALRVVVGVPAETGIRPWAIAEPVRP